jgi:signal transduction histidine kinase
MLIGVLAFAPTIVLMLGYENNLARLVPIAGIVSYTLVLGAAVVSYFHWRLTAAGALDHRLAQWLAVGLTVGSVNGILQVIALLDGRHGWPIAGQPVLVLVLCVGVVLAERVDVPGNLALVCVGATTLVVAVYSAARHIAPRLVLGDTQIDVAGTATMLAALALAWIVLNRPQVSLWARRRLAAAILLLTGAQCATNTGVDHHLLQGATVVAFLLGAVILCVLTQHLLRGSILRHTAELDRSQRSLAEVRARILEDRQLLHEVGSTLAGITTASRVMRHEHGVPAQRRQRLESMLSAELARLERLMLNRVGGAESEEDTWMHVDDVVEPVVISHQERGRQVTWAPCGEEGLGDPDELAEVCNILLENAARHARGSEVSLSVSVQGDEVVIACADDGPGVPLELRERIFDPEVKGSRSPGQGLGLAIAHRLASSRGGRIELVDDGTPGATFVARLPRKVTSDVPACIVA